MHMPRRAIIALASLSLAATTVPSIAGAQRTGVAPAATRRPSTDSADTASLAIRTGDWMVSVNPLGLLYGGLTGEAERKLGEKRTAAVAANYWSMWGSSYLSMDLKYRFYQRSGSTVADFEGFSFGPMVGFQRIGVTGCEVATAYDEEDVQCSATGLTVGGTVDYGWRVGRQKAVSLVAGGGLKAGFGYGALSGAHVTYPFVRLAVGYIPRKASR